MDKIMNFPLEVIVDKDLQHLVRDFIKGRQENLSNLERSLSDEDWEQISRIGHIMAGVCGSFGFDALGEAGLEIEEYAHQKNKAALTSMLPQMKTYLRDVKMILQ